MVVQNKKRYRAFLIGFSHLVPSFSKHPGSRTQVPKVGPSEL